MKITRDAVWHTTKDYSIITLGLIFYAVGFCGFILPHGVITGGLAGIAALIFFKTGIPVAYSFYTLNIILLSIAYRIVGRGFVLKTIYGASGLSLFMLIAQMFFKSHPVYLEHDILLSCIIGAVLCGVGTGLAFTHNGSTGGTDIVALILAKYTSMEIGKALMVSDILIVLAAAWRFGMGTGLYCILGLIGKSFVVDGAIENIRLRKVCTIMTANPQPILDFIIKEMNRSATVEKAYGAYTHHELSVLVTVLTRRQALQLRNFLRENDPHSFITIVNSSEIIGKGFRSFN